MSAYICNNDTYKTIVAAALSQPVNRHETEVLGLPLTKILSGIDTTSWELHEALYNLNEEAFCQRYPSTNSSGERTRYPENLGFEPFNLEAEEYLYRLPLRIKREDLIPALKATQCLLYQCSEGDVPEHPLFKALEEFIARLAKDYSESSTEYLAAKWG